MDDGGPAFGTGNPEQGGWEGMTLRQWYAGMALQGMISNLRDCLNIVKLTKEEQKAAQMTNMAKAAFLYADSMLKEIENGK